MFIILLLILLIVIIFYLLIKNSIGAVHHNNFIDFDKITNKQIKNINNLEKHVFVSFYTYDNGYKKYAGRLIDSLNKHNLSYYILEIHTNNYSWAELTKLKPYLLLNAMKLFPDKNICWIDSDATLNKYPNLLNKIDKNIAISCRNSMGKNYICKVPWSCFIYFKNNSFSKNFINDWLNNFKNYGADQHPIREIINNKYLEDIEMLPNSFIKKYYDNRTDSTIIEHEASTTNKDNKINKPGSSVRGT